MSEAEHRTRDCAQYHARAKSQPGLGTGRNGKGQSDHAKDGNRPGAHDRSPADCRTLLNGRVWQSFPLRRSLGSRANFAGCSSYTQKAGWNRMDPPLRQTIKSHLAYVNLTDAL